MRCGSYDAKTELAKQAPDYVQQFVLDRGGLRTGHLVDRDQGRGDRLEDGITRRGGPKLVAKASPVPTPGDTPQPDPVSLEHTLRLRLDVATYVDHPPARAEQKAQPVARFTLDVDFSVPARASQLRQSLRIGAVRLVHPRGQRLMCRPRIDAHHRCAKGGEFPRQSYE